MYETKCRERVAVAVQCDQMDRLFIQYSAVFKNEYLPNSSIANLPK